MELKIARMLKRIGEDDIQRLFFSKTAILILGLLRGEGSRTPSKLREHISSNFPHDEMLRSSKIRHLLLNTLRQEEAEKLLHEIGTKFSKSEDIYELLNKTRFSKNSGSEKILFRFFEEEPPLQEDDVNATPLKKEVEKITVKHGLFPHQRHAFYNIIASIESSKMRRCLLHMPTGSGKTTTAMRVVSSIFSNSSPVMVVWLAYSEDLCEQAIDEFKNTWEHVGDRDIRVFRYFGKHSPDLLGMTKISKESFVVASLSKVQMADKKQSVFLSTLADRTDMVVMDEAHQATAPTYKTVLQQLVEKRPKHIRLLGLSATPGRPPSDPTESDKLARFFNRTKVTLSVRGYRNPVKYLMDNDYLAKPVLRPVRADGRLTEDDVRRIAKSPLDIPEDILRRIGRDSRRTLKVIGQILDLAESGKHRRIMVFGASIENSRDIYMILTALGYKAFHVDSNTSFETRERSIHEFRSETDDVVIMCNFGVFTTGFDAPRTSAAVIARPTKSIILYSQMAGRAMRGKKVGGNANCEIRTITDINLPHFTRLTDGFFSWEDVW